MSSARQAPLDTRITLGAFGILLIGYAFMGRGFAYLGVKPLFVGEIAILMGLMTVGLRLRTWEVLRAALSIPVLVFMGWGVLRAVPYLGEYRIDVLRDSVAWGYAVVALLVAGSVLAWPAWFGIILDRYRWFAVWFPLFMMVLWPVQRAFWASLPRWPHAFGGGQAVIMNKPGDIYVHLAGISAFLLAGTLGRVRIWSQIAIALTAVVAASGRGGMLAFASALGLSLVSRRPTRRVEMLLMSVAAIYLLLLVTGLEINFTGSGRSISARQITSQYLSIFTTDDSSLDATKLWRIRWWETIWEGSFFGDHFWGRGYGINLAAADGFENDDVHQGLRSPHSIHMTMLARGGVPGLMIWGGVNLIWVSRMVIGYLSARRYGRQKWAGVFTWLTAYWCAFVINGSFDVFIEGPMGGIWFWAVFGFGIAADHLYRHNHEVLPDPSGNDLSAKEYVNG